MGDLRDVHSWLDNFSNFIIFCILKQGRIDITFAIKKTSVHVSINNDMLEYFFVILQSESPPLYIATVAKTIMERFKPTGNWSATKFFVGFMHSKLTTETEKWDIF